jgi:branched-chain amino acid transport system ATP-binding protein
MFEIKKLTKSFGGIYAVKDLSFIVKKGEIVGLIGPNGAGKTTLFNVITGYHKADSGNIMFQGKEIINLPTYKIAHEGIVRTFQSTVLFQEMTVLQNLLVGDIEEKRPTFLSTMINSKSYQSYETISKNKAHEILKFMGLNKFSSSKAKNLPYGYQRKLGICIALMTGPLLLLLDEPVTGMNPTEAEQMIQDINKIREQLGISILIIEHNMKVIMNISDKIVAISYGEMLAEGRPIDIQHNSKVIEAYLGVDKGEKNNDISGKRG